MDSWRNASHFLPPCLSAGLSRELTGVASCLDSQVLMLQHPLSMIRDTARYRAYMRPQGKDGGKLKPRKLKDLAKEVLGMEIQDGKHDSVGF